jgi:adenylate cyclase
MTIDDAIHCEQTLMFTDIVGYSRLMGANESLAVEMLGEYRRILLADIQLHGGQLVEFVGDAIFARFDTATQAVAAAISIQQHLVVFNEDRDKKLPRLQTRIGLHKGEVMLRDNAVFGDSVNIAARLEPLAVADGICISQSVYDEVRFFLSAPAKRLGAQTLKNIQQKIRVYLIKPAGIGWRDHFHYFIRGINRKISAYRYPLTFCLLTLIAAGFYFIPRWLVPGYAANYVEITDFKNLMNEKGDADYFSAGITAAVRSQLADMRDVYIIDEKEGVHAPIRLEGSVQKLGDNLRIAYRLFRSKDNVQIAGGKLDGTYQDIFILQDRLVGEIARYLADEFDLQNFRPAPLRLTNNITAYDLYMRGMEFLEKPTSHDNVDEAITYFNTALVHDAKFASANVGLCKAYWKKYSLSSAAQWLNDAEKQCLLALSNDPNNPDAYASIGAIYRLTGKYDLAIQYLQKGLTIDKSSLHLTVMLARVYDLANKRNAAENIFVELMNKYPQNWRIYNHYGQFLTTNGQYEEAIEIYKKALEFDSNSFFALSNIGINYFYLSNFDQAAIYFEKTVKLQPYSKAFSNSGSVYYYAQNFEKAVSMYKEAFRLEPENYRWAANIADAYKFIKGEKEMADTYFEKSIDLSRQAIETNPNIDRTYHYLAISLAYFGKASDAKLALESAEKLNPNSESLLYAKLRTAVFLQNNSEIQQYYQDLINSGYSVKLLQADPDFRALRPDTKH